MKFSKYYKDKLKKTHNKYIALSKTNRELLKILNEVEIPEGVYNSNAIENSTLTINDTENIILYNDVAKYMDLREVFEAKNLNTIMNYIENNISSRNIDIEFSNFLHSILLSGIDDDIKGRIRMGNEFVRVGKHIAPAPQEIAKMLQDAFYKVFNIYDKYDIIEIVARFHLEFEFIHPYLDGNGRIGRVLVNFIFMKNGFPPIIIRNKEKDNYYRAFRSYQISNVNNNESTDNMSFIFYFAMMESLHKRIAYMDHKEIITLSDYAKYNNIKLNNLLNKAKAQTIPAFRERGIWKIGIDFTN